MRCEDWGPRGCEGGGRARCENYPDCHSGWLPFWTPAERAGINVMGRHYKYLRSISPIRAASVRATIRAYVAASRRAKEEGR
jgi:hypothetical protein